MRKLRVGVIDLVSQKPTRALWARVMNANLSSIMPQVVGIWSKEEGHEVSFLCYTGFEDLEHALPSNLDIVFIGAFTESAHLAYAISAYFRSKGTVTALGGPHARCYPDDARRYFDYVLGFTDRALIREVLHDCSHHQPDGVRLSADRQPLALPGVRERWDFIESTLQKAPFFKFVPMIASLGCPYTCSFCIDSTVPYQLLDVDVLKEDLRFLLTRFKRPIVAWHDPNFGVRFDNLMDAIEEAIPPDSIDFVAESSLSLLTEAHMQRLKKNGFKALLPGIESWFDLGEKSRTGSVRGHEKVDRLSQQVNMILRYIPYIQTNFVLGLDCDSGPEPFELTKRFVDLTPGAFPGYSLLSSFGEAAPLNLEYQRDGRVIGFPFHYLNNNGAMNLKPKNYAWPEFYRHVIDLTRHSFSPRAIARRALATDAFIPRWLNMVRAISSEGYGRIHYYTDIAQRLAKDSGFRAYFEQDTDALPEFYSQKIQQDLGPLWKWLPAGGGEHDPYAYLKATDAASPAGEETQRTVA